MEGKERGGDAGRIHIFRYHREQHCRRHRTAGHRTAEACRERGEHQGIHRLAPAGLQHQNRHGGERLSQGQKQRLLIARAVYKNPEFLFFDEATNALDANNEKEIMEHLHEFYRGKTVVVVAHRLSTVRDADKIGAGQGEGGRRGHAPELTEKRGLYYRLVKNQLELGN